MPTDLPPDYRGKTEHPLEGSAIQRACAYAVMLAITGVVVSVAIWVIAVVLRAAAVV